MAVTGINNYSNVYESVYDLQKANNKEVNNQTYLNKLQKQRTHVKLAEGMGLSMKIDQKQGAITINPKLLERMQNDPEAEKQYTELIKNIEMAEKTVGAYYNAMGGYVERTSHWYIDENGNYSHFGYIRRDDRLNKKLREEAKKNAEKLVERSREKVTEKRKRLEEVMKKRLEEKRKEASEDGGIFFDTKDMKPIIDAIKGEEQESVKIARAADRDVAVGSSVDVVI